MNWIVSLIVIAFLLRRIWLLAYNLFAHPLKKVPGPALYAVSNIPKTWRSNVVGKHWTDLVDMHQKYGNVVRIGPDEVSFVSAQSWKTIHGTGSNSFQRDPNLMAVLQKATDTLGSADRETHRLFRNLVAPVFSDSSLRTQEPVIVEVAQRMVYALKERCGTPVDISLVFQWALIDVMGELMLGQSFDCLKNFESPTWVSLMATGKKSFAVIQMVLSFTVPALLYKAILHLPVVQKWIQSLELTKEKTKQRLDRGASARRDVMTLMWEEAQGASMIITRDRVERLGSLLFFVGYETTATALSGIIWGLLAAPEAYRRLTDEIRDLRKEDLRPATLLSLSYLNGVIQEGLRSHNPVGIAVTRIVPKGGAFIDGYHLPEGTKCGIPHWASSNLPRHFHEPSKFFPERWLPEEDLRFKSDVLEVVQAFGRGSMGCIGKQLALTELRLFLATLFWHFDISLEADSASWSSKTSVVRILRQQVPLMVKLRPAVIHPNLTAQDFRSSKAETA